VNAAAGAFWATLPLGGGVTLLAHDANGLAAFYKPAGVLSHPNAAGDEPRALLTARYALETESFEWSGEGSDAPATPLAAQPARLSHVRRDPRGERWRARRGNS